jgi:hypothetical protein
MNRRSFITILFFSIFCVFPCPGKAGDAVIIDADKPVVVMIFDDKCKKWCSEVRPILHALKEEYGDKVAFHEIDCSEKVLKAANESARQLGLGHFLGGVIDYVPVVGVFTPKRRLIKEIIGSKSRETYVSYIETALKAK